MIIVLLPSGELLIGASFAVLSDVRWGRRWIVTLNGLLIVHKLVNLVVLLGGDQAVAVRDEADRRWVIILVALQLCNELVIVRHHALITLIAKLLHFCSQFSLLLFGSLGKVFKSDDLNCILISFILLGLDLVQTCDENLRSLRANCSVDQNLEVVDIDKIFNHDLPIVSRFIYLLIWV